ncbi:hypothetical protein F383_17222 [Gossypium arboreum]|uniref:Uncharacterized protein n=1 Tax=Gossypium arboreum TaxID=29729 RepID=A0A0B0NN89_GOSAR|nr:hypothetical protein F383_17222 [Gossypium arboreum]
MPLSQKGFYLHTYIGILCHDMGLSGVITRSKRILEHGYQAYTHSAIACINSYITYQHI